MVSDSEFVEVADDDDGEGAVVINVVGVFVVAVVVVVVVTAPLTVGGEGGSNLVLLAPLTRKVGTFSGLGHEWGHFLCEQSVAGRVVGRLWDENKGHEP